MSTRSLTYMYDDGTPLVCMYRQSDGYPAGMGRDLFNFLSSLTMVNGLPLTPPDKVANGAGCLAAQLIVHFKTGAGGIYLYPTEQNQDAGQEYEYHIDVDEKNILHITVTDASHVLFKGALPSFGAWIELERTS